MRRLPREGSLADVPGIRVGHAEDPRGLTGCTVILCEAGAVAGLDVRGGGGGVRDPFVCRPDHVASRVHAVLFSGGSAFGLDATAGVMRFLRERGVGLRTSVLPIPIVPAAILFDLGLGRPVFPGPEMAYGACRSASAGPVREGNVGAGTGAAVGKIGGIERATKSGLGTACAREGGLRVAALAVVNAFGDVTDPATGRILAGARTSPRGRRFAGTARWMRAGAAPPGWARESTTLVCLATNARLDRVEANRLAAVGQNCLARVIRPAQTVYDGDLTFALALGRIEASPTRLQPLAEHAVERAVLRAVLSAEPSGGLPAARDLRPLRTT
ncbi:MAG: P1 family peptidase [Acidobacteria bacterium]|nr:P1 family peptidase [Acidobacteriota bacterium]